LGEIRLHPTQTREKNGTTQARGKSGIFDDLRPEFRKKQKYPISP
jgi:hypothetical protein